MNISMFNIWSFDGKGTTLRADRSSKADIYIVTRVVFIENVRPVHCLVTINVNVRSLSPFFATICE